MTISKQIERDATRTDQSGGGTVSFTDRVENLSRTKIDVTFLNEGGSCIPLHFDTVNRAVLAFGILEKRSILFVELLINRSIYKSHQI